MYILYISSWHPVLEYDDLSVFNTLGHTWFSTGVYKNPTAPHSSIMRGNLSKHANLGEVLEEYDSLNPSYEPRAQIKLTKDFVSKFDLIFVSNFFHYLNHWELFRGKPTIYRTYDRHDPKHEQVISSLRDQGLKVVRMFKFETRIPWACKADAVIRNFVDPQHQPTYEGTEESILTFNNDFLIRANYKDPYGSQPFEGYRLYSQLRNNFPAKLYGDNNRVPFCRGRLSWEEQKQQLKSCRAYFSLGSKPGPYTYSLVEAMMSGMPTINFGMELGDYKHPFYSGCYEVPQFIETGINGVVSDNPKELLEWITLLLKEPALAKEIGDRGKQTAIDLFNKKDVDNMWKDFFDKL